MGIRVFIGYGYNVRDAWVDSHVIPIVRATGCEVVHGREVWGGPLPDEILRLIQTSDALLAFTTRRNPAGVSAEGLDQFTTHPWVLKELTDALSQDPPLPCVEVRELGVMIPPGGIIEETGAQRIDYSEANRADCLRDVALAAARLRDRIGVTTVRLQPESAARNIRPLIDHATFLCTSQTLRDERESAPVKTSVLRVEGSLIVKLRGLRQGDLVRLDISAQGRTWRTEYESLDTIDIELAE